MSRFLYPPTPIDKTGLASDTKQDEIIAELALDIIDFLDTPVLEAASSNIPASASSPLTVVASLAADVKAIKFNDTTGEYIGVYSDPAGTPVLECMIGPGEDQTVQIQLTAGTVIGVRNMKNSTIALGDLTLQFLG